MKLKYLLITFLLFVLFSSCAVVAGIFKAGVWVGVLLVLLILGVIILIVSRINK